MMIIIKGGRKYSVVTLFKISRRGFIVINPNIFYLYNIYIEYVHIIRHASITYKKKDMHLQRQISTDKITDTNNMFNF